MKRFPKWTNVSDRIAKHWLLDKSQCLITDRANSDNIIVRLCEKAPCDGPSESCDEAPETCDGEASARAAARTVSGSDSPPLIALRIQKELFSGDAHCRVSPAH
jgi:hypothetical protein